MSDTLERAIESVVMQLDDDYEVLVVDDGSSDSSFLVLEKLSKRFNQLRYLLLKRDSSRKLGLTRNICIEEARGDYILLHIDADDVWEPYIRDFVQVFHKLESCIGKDFLLSGQQVNMGKKDFLIKHGPYRNIYRGEDRDLWMRLASIGAYIPLEHVVFRTRLSRPKVIKLRKIILDTASHLLGDLRLSTQLDRQNYVWRCLTEVFLNRYRVFNLRHRLLRALLVLPAYLISQLDEPLAPTSISHSDFVDYRERTRGTYGEIMERLGYDSNLDFLRYEARHIFESDSGT